MNKARRWLHGKVRGTERTGVLVTKESARFKPLGVHVLQSGDENAVHWFLEDKTSTRSSNYLEDAATEIQVQGLELDYTCLIWDADFRSKKDGWSYHTVRNSRWCNNSDPINQDYQLNAYRVLLTRARKGMVICVPEGSTDDHTRQPAFYDETYEYLKSLGIKEI